MSSHRSTGKPYVPPDPKYFDYENRYHMPGGIHSYVAPISYMPQTKTLGIEAFMQQKQDVNRYKIEMLLWTQARNQLSALDMSEAALEDFRQQSEIMLLNYSHWLLKHEFKCPDFSELRLFSKSLRLMGIIDAVHQEPGQAVIIDYKTSQRCELTDDINRQAAIYSLLYQDRYQEIPQAIWIHFLINPDEPVPIHVDEHLLDYGKLLVASVREKTRSDREVDYPCTCGGFCEKDLIGK